MNNIDDTQSIDFWKKFQEIRFDISKANLEDVKNILNHYNQSPYVVDGKSYHYDINPLDAACLNARYKQLTGENHSTFIREQIKVLDRIIELDDGLSFNGKPTIYQRLKNNLTGEGLGISIIPNRNDSYIKKFEKIQFDISKASLEDIKDILDYYDQDSVLIDGIQHHFRPNPSYAACLNARYKQLSGKDHSTFIKTQEEILKEIVNDHQGIKVNGNPTIYEQLQNNLTGKNNGIEIGQSDHIINRTYKIINHLDTASLGDINDLLNYYNGKPILINGVVHHPFNDPMLAVKLNARYRELTGKAHPVFVEQVPVVIDGLMKDKDMLI